MAIESLAFGQSLSGLLVDGVEETPYTGATLRLEEPRGVVVDVPYVHHDDTEQFRHVDGWFNTQTPPMNLILQTPDGQVGLFGIKWRGHSVSSGVSLGKLAPAETVLGRCEASLDEPLKLAEVRSQVDGLRQWTRFYGIETEPETDDDGLTQGLVVRVRSGGEVTWQQGEVTLKFVTTWKTNHPEEDPHGGLDIREHVVLVSQFPTTRPFNDHLAEQRKVVSLLTLITGHPILFRRHQVWDETIVSRSVGGTILGHPRVDLISTQTVRDYTQPRLRKTEADDMLVRLPDVGEAGMSRWAEQFETWKRFIFPAVGVLGRREAFMEDVIISTSMSIEAAGQIIGVRDGEEPTYYRGRPTTATNVYRCLNLLGVPWGSITTDHQSLARAVANTYNDIKHFDRGEFPETSVSHTISHITKMIVRLLTLHILDESGGLLRQYREQGAMWKVQRYSEVYGLTFDERGHPVFSGDGTAEGQG